MSDAALALIDATSLTTNKGGAAFYFAPETLAKGKELGLDGFRWYFIGRGGVLGDVEPAVVQSAYGYFNTPLVEKIWNSSKERIEPRVAGTAYVECCGEIGRLRLDGVDGLEAYNEAADAVISAAEPSALTLFAAVAAEPRSGDPAARAMQNMAVLRELRGSVHLVALVASGLSAAVAHAIKRPDDVATFGYEEPPIIEPDDPARHEAAEVLTSQLLVPAYSVLDDAGGAALAAGTDAIAKALGV